MSSFDKVVKLACKPKAAPPKSKYLEPIIAATWSDEGAIHDVCRALSPRFREPNAIVVFKALIVLHTMIRNGATDNVLGYLSSSEVLRLRNVSAGNWDGYAAPENIQNYAGYLDSRIRAYHDLKHDAVRVQAESNRDMRNSQSIEEDSYRSRGGKTLASPASSGPTRSKTIMGRKLRIMTVEKGLLRETKVVQGMIDTLVECRFYLDDLEDELTTTALRMLVKDLLILFQAGNEGVINVLEHYFEMSHVDAEQALAIYRHFCKQTERVVEFLGVAKKLQNLLNVPIPNLKHAPVSLAGALQEYLNDPNFEQNRIEYKTNKDAADNPVKKITPTLTKTKTEKSSSSPAPASTQSTISTSSSTSAPSSKDVVDFFTTIEEEQPTMFNPQTNSPNTTYFQQQSTANPFAQMQMTGQPFMQAQSTGFIQPQHTAFQLSPTNPFSLQIQHHQPINHQSFSAFLPGQPPGVVQRPQQTGFLQPQATGANPFRQSMLFPQSTGLVMPNGGMAEQRNLNPFPNAVATPQGQGASFGFSTPKPFTSTGISFSSASSSVTSPFTQTAPESTQQTSLPARPSSTPLTIGSSSNATSPPIVQAVKTHQTGTKNPFGPIPVVPPPVPKQPTLMELSMGMGANVRQPSQQQSPSSQLPQTGGSGFGFNSGALSAGATDISSIASSFAFNKSNGAANTQANPSGTGALNAQVTNAPSVPSITVSDPIKPQFTGFAGLKPFKPSSAFGASLLESLPPIPGSSSITSAATANNSVGVAPNSTGTPGLGPQAAGIYTAEQPAGTANVNGGASLGQRLGPQMTSGVANPFRASMVGSPTGTPNQNASPISNLSANTAFGANLFSGDNAALRQNTSLF